MLSKVSRDPAHRRRAVRGAGLPVRRHPGSHERGDSRCRLTRRDFIRADRGGRGRRRGRHSRCRALAQAGGRPDAAGLKWSKAPCRFCGTGCGVMVAVKDNRVVATHGDPEAEVNRGLNCVKGYFLSKIMYGEDRLTTPLLRMKNGQYAKDGEFQPRVLGPGLRRDGRAVQARAEGQGPDRGRHVRLRPVDGLGRLRGAQADEGRLPLQQPRPQRAPLHGLGRAWASCAPSAWTSRWAATTTSRPPTPSCCGAPTWRRCTRSCGRG